MRETVNISPDTVVKSSRHDRRADNGLYRVHHKIKKKAASVASHSSQKKAQRGAESLPTSPLYSIIRQEESQEGKRNDE